MSQVEMKWEIINQKEGKKRGEKLLRTDETDSKQLARW